jgi:hypothetical protein
MVRRWEDGGVGLDCNSLHLDVLQLSGSLAGDVKEREMETRPAIFKWRQTEPGLILCAVRWYLRYSLSLRDVEELLEERGLNVDHTTVQRCRFRLAEVFADHKCPKLSELLWIPRDLRLRSVVE